MIVLITYFAVGKIPYWAVKLGTVVVAILLLAIVILPSLAKASMEEFAKTLEKKARATGRMLDRLSKHQ